VNSERVTLLITPDCPGRKARGAGEIGLLSSASGAMRSAIMRIHPIAACWILGTALALTACSSTKNQRISQNEALFNTYTPAERQMIRTGQVAVGFDQDMVRMALGDPSRETTVDTAAGKQLVWEYSHLKPTLGIGVGGGVGTRGSGVGIGTGVGVSPNNTKLRKRVVFDRQTGEVARVESYD